MAQKKDFKKPDDTIRTYTGLYYCFENPQPDQMFALLQKEGEVYTQIKAADIAVQQAEHDRLFGDQVAGTKLEVWSSEVAEQKFAAAFIAICQDMGLNHLILTPEQWPESVSR